MILPARRSDTANFLFESTQYNFPARVRQMAMVAQQGFAGYAMGFGFHN